MRRVAVVALFVVLAQVAPMARAETGAVEVDQLATRDADVEVVRRRATAATAFETCFDAAAADPLPAIDEPTTQDKGADAEVRSQRKSYRIDMHARVYCWHGVSGRSRRGIGLHGS